MSFEGRWPFTETIPPATSAIDLAACIALVRRGRFENALNCLRTLKISAGGEFFQKQQLLLSDALQRTGNNDEATDLASRLMQAQNVLPETLARTHFVLGNVARNRGSSPQAVLHYQKAISLADANKFRTLGGWARLRLMATVSDVSGMDAGVALLPDIRRQLVNIGEPGLFAALHLWIAEVESKRGSLGNARRHVVTARSLLEEVDNAWLWGNLATNSFGVHYYSAELTKAADCAQAAAHYSTLSGHAAAKRAAFANLGHVEFSHGHLAVARRYFDRALEHCEPHSASQVSVLDSIAQIALEDGDLEAVESILSEVQRLVHNTSKSTESRAWILQTKLQLLLKQGRVREATEVCSRLTGFTNCNHPRPQLLLNLLKVETLLASGQLDEASRLITTLLESDQLPVDIVAEIEWVLGKAARISGHSDIATIHLERAVEILSAVGNEPRRASASLDLSKAQSTETREVDPSAEVRRVVDRVRVLFDLVARPQLLGRETFKLLTELKCTRHLSLVATNERSDSEILASTEPGHRVPSQLVPLVTSEVSLSLGRLDDKTFHLVITPNHDLGSQISCAAVKRIITNLLESAFARQRLAENAALWPQEQLPSDDGTVLTSQSMIEIMSRVRKIAVTNIPVLLTGETGTGKEVLARSLHRSSGRAGKAFVAFNCSTVPRDLVESQLFGYRRGAFSGATEHFQGIIRAASGGTLFLDEVGELSLDVQPKLLRFLECGEIHPLGESQAIEVDARVIMATNANLEEAVDAGRFREDLFFRMNVVRFEIPPLRERREEIPALVEHFLKKFCAEFSKERLRVTAEAMELLSIYSWPGNVRQLANEMRRFVALADNGAIAGASDLSPKISGSEKNTAGPTVENGIRKLTLDLDQTLGRAVERLERSMLRHALEQAGGRVEVAARALGLSRKGLYLKRQRLGLA